MRLSHALRVDPGSVVAFVGGGGKSSAMFRLAAELAERGPVITTTTTRIFTAQISLVPVHVSLASPDDVSGLARLLSTQPHVLVTGKPDPDRAGKTPGISLETLSAILTQTAALAPTILVEADGAGRRPFKAPASHEPVIPPQATHVVPVVGADAVGRPLTEEFVHRAGLVADLAGASPGDSVTPEIIAAVLAHPEGGLKGVPPDARISLLFNKVESPESRQAGLEIADQLLAGPAYNSIVFSSAKSDDPVLAVHGRTVGIVLAAGGSRRFGNRPKQLAPFRGKPLVAHAVDAALAARLDEVIVVTGEAGAEVAAALEDRPVRTGARVTPALVENPRWSEGQSTSVKAGLGAISPGVDAAIFLLADQPRVAPDLIPALLAAHRATLAPIVAPRHGGRRGNPVLFDRAAWPDLLGLTGDTGGRVLFEKYAEEVVWVEGDEGILVDVDTEDDYERLVT